MLHSHLEIISKSKKGYENNDEDLCENVNECLIGEHLCDHHADCIDLTGEYKCQCHEGYAGDGYNCLNINECLTTSSTAKSVCPPNSECIDTIASYECVCQTGFEGDITCTDINECATDYHVCHEFATCENTIASYFCYCNAGYRDVSPPDGHECVEDNECRDQPDACPDNANCVNTVASYECHCNDGWFWGDDLCLDVNECYDRTHNCHENSECENTEGSYECKCHTGYTMESRRINTLEGAGMGEEGCADIDECKDDLLNMCDRDANCFNTDGTYTCECKEGFHGTGFNVDLGSWRSAYGKSSIERGCFNINECKTSRTDCDPNATCVDLEGLFRCECNTGYHGSGDKCFDDDECKLGTHNCDPMKSICINVEMPTQWRCECKEGYRHEDIGLDLRLDCG